MRTSETVEPLLTQAHHGRSSAPQAEQRDSPRRVTQRCTLSNTQSGWRSGHLACRPDAKIRLPQICIDRGPEATHDARDYADLISVPAMRGRGRRDRRVLRWET